VYGFVRTHGTNESKSSSFLTYVTAMATNASPTTRLIVPSSVGKSSQPTTTLGRQHRKRKTRTVLEEDEFLERLGAIVERDFFPPEDGVGGVPRCRDPEGVDAFLAKYTSEDDASFEALMRKEKKKCNHVIERTTAMTTTKRRSKRLRDRRRSSPPRVRHRNTRFERIAETPPPLKTTTATTRRAADEYSYVEATPSLDPDAVPPPMTWGTLNGPPRPLSPSLTPAGARLAKRLGLSRSMALV